MNIVAIEFENPIIVPLINEFNSYKGGRDISTKTPLCEALQNKISAIDSENENSNETDDMYSSYIAPHPHQCNEMNSSYNGPRNDHVT